MREFTVSEKNAKLRGLSGLEPVTLVTKVDQTELECGPVPNVMAALPNIGGALCSVPQSLADAQLLECRAVTLPRRKTS